MDFKEINLIIEKPNDNDFSINETKNGEDKMHSFLIRALKDSGEELFLGIDQNSGGYPVWSGYIHNANFFKTKEDAEKMLIDCKMSRFPYLAHEAAGLCIYKTKGSFLLEIVKIKFEAVYSKEVKAEFNLEK